MRTYRFGVITGMIILIFGLTGCGSTQVSTSHETQSVQKSKSASKSIVQTKSSSLKSLTSTQAFNLAMKADKDITSQWTINQWSAPWLVVSGPVVNANVSQGAIFLIKNRQAVLVHKGTMIPRLASFPIPGHPHLVIGMGTVSGCDVSGPYVINSYCAQGFTNMIILSSHWPYIVKHWEGLPGSASIVSLPHKHIGIDFVLDTPYFNGNGSLTGWNTNKPFESVVLQWDSSAQTLAVNHFGFELTNLTPSLAKGLGYQGQGVYLGYTMPPASTDNVPAPSIITSFEGIPVTSATQITLQESRSTPLTPVTITVWHGGATTPFTITPTQESFSSWLANSINIISDPSPSASIPSSSPSSTPSPSSSPSPSPSS